MTTIGYEKNLGIAEIKINRPEKKNSLTSKMYGELTACFNKAGLDHSVVVVILKGQGDMFTAGNDINDFANTPKITDSENTNVIKFIKITNYDVMSLI